MKKIFTLAMVALTAVATATAKDFTPAPGQVAQKLNITAPRGNINGRAIDSRSQDIITNGTRIQTPQSRAAEGVIYEAQGQAKYYNLDVEGYYVYYFYQIWGTSSFGGQIVWGDNNEVYINNAVPNNPVGSYIKATVDGDKIVAQLPQLIDEYEYYGDIIPYYVSKMTPCLDSYGYESYEPVADEENFISWTIHEDGSITLDNDVPDVVIDEESGYPVEDPASIIGVYYLYPGDEEYTFASTGDYRQTYTPIDVEKYAVDVPEGLQYESWAMLALNIAGNYVDVAIDGNDIYVKGFSEYMPDAVIKGKIDGDKVTFEPRQYLGYWQQYSYFGWLMSGKIERAYDEEWDEYYDLINLTDNFVFDYDAEGKSLTSAQDDALVVNTNDTYVFYMEAFQSPSIKYISPELLNAAPLNPSLLEVADYTEYEGAFFFLWDIPCVNTNGALLDTNSMYYNIYMDGEIYEFYTDMYFALEDDMIDIPYNFTDDWDFTQDGRDHGMYIYDEGYNEIGIQSHYIAEDGTIYSSEIVNFELNSGIKDIASSKAISSVSYYNMAGVKVANPTAGLYIKSTVYSDGSRRAEKVAIR